MKIAKILIIFIVLLSSIAASAQSYREHRGDVYFDRFNYNKAIEQYLMVMEKEPENHFVMQKLAESYKYLNIDTASVNWYAKLIATSKYENKDLFNYAAVLKTIGDYKKSDEYLKKYIAQKQESKYLLNDENIDELLKDTFRFKITLIAASSEFADFAPAYFGNKIIFASSRQGTDFLHREYERDGEAYLQLYVADTLAGGQLDSIRLFDNKLNTRYHEGPVCFCSADSTMYFTRNNYKFLKGMSTDGQVKLKIYTSKFTYNQWLKYAENTLDSVGINVNLNKNDWRWVKEFKYNNKNYSTGHPSVTKDGRIIYFVSDMPGGKGGTDIYACTRIGKNEWSEPQNLRELNTEGNEMFPFIHESGVLFFASDGWPGLGGLDIFKANPDGQRFEKPQNMGAPLNSKADDFGLIADQEAKTGYFSSNRPGGKGGDDLYHVIFNNKVEFVLAGTVSEKDTKTPISNAVIHLTNTDDGSLTSVQADENGYYTTTINFNQTFNIQCVKGLYLPFSDQLNPKEIQMVNDTVFYNMELDYYGIYGSVFLKGSGEKVPGVNIACIPTNSRDTIKYTSDTLGNFKILLDRDTDYDLRFAKKDFFALKANYSTVGRATGWINVNKFIELEIEKIELNKTIEIPNIYYDLGKWNIRDDAAVELEKVVEFMTDNATIYIELGSHTDARGSSKSNQILSQKRAESAVNWIVNHGIDTNRISAKGYGETKIKNRCVDGVKCSEAEHQENRRTEIKITSF